MIVSGQIFSAGRKLVRCCVNEVSLAAVFLDVECYTYVTTRTTGHPRPSGHPFQYSEIEVIYPWAFVFLSWFWKRFAHGQDCFSERFQNTIRNRF